MDYNLEQIKETSEVLTFILRFSGAVLSLANKLYFKVNRSAPF